MGDQVSTVYVRITVRNRLQHVELGRGLKGILVPQDHGGDLLPADPLPPAVSEKVDCYSHWLAFGEGVDLPREYFYRGIVHAVAFLQLCQHILSKVRGHVAARPPLDLDENWEGAVWIQHLLTFLR